MRELTERMEVHIVSELGPKLEEEMEEVSSRKISNMVAEQLRVTRQLPNTELDGRRFGLKRLELIEGCFPSQSAQVAVVVVIGVPNRRLVVLLRW